MVLTEVVRVASVASAVILLVLAGACLVIYLFVGAKWLDIWRRRYEHRFVEQMLATSMRVRAYQESMYNLTKALQEEGSYISARDDQEEIIELGCQSEDRVVTLVSAVQSINESYRQGLLRKFNKKRWMLAKKSLDGAIKLLETEQANIDMLAWLVKYGPDYTSEFQKSIVDTAAWARVLQGIVSTREHGPLITAEVVLQDISERYQRGEDVPFAKASNALALSRIAIRDAEKTYAPQIED